MQILVLEMNRTARFFRQTLSGQIVYLICFVSQDLISLCCGLKNAVRKAVLPPFMFYVPTYYVKAAMVKF